MATFTMPSFRARENPLQQFLQGALQGYTGMTQAQYLPKQLQAGLEQTQANTLRQQILNQLLPEHEKAKLAYEQGELPYQAARTNFQQILNQWLPRSEAARVKLAEMQPEYQAATTAHQQMINDIYPQLQQSIINKNQFGGSAGGVDAHNMQSFRAQIMKENPNASPQEIDDIMNAHFTASDTLPSGAPTPQLSGVGGSLLATILKRTVGTKAQEKAMTANNAMQAMQAVDIEPIASYGSPQGKMRFTLQSMGVLPKDENFYAANQFKSVTSNLIVDNLRNILGTSVSPGYVAKNLYPIVDPLSNVLNDPKAIKRNWNALISAMQQYNQDLQKQSRTGAVANLKTSLDKIISSSQDMPKKESSGLPSKSSMINARKQLDKDTAAFKAEQIDQLPEGKVEAMIDTPKGKRYKINGKWVEYAQG